MEKRSITSRIGRLRASNPRLVWKFLHWPGAPVWKKILVFVAFGWLVSPLDGDFVPFIGWLDDIALTFLSWWTVTNSIQDMEEHKQLHAAATVDAEPKSQLPETGKQ